MCIYESLSHIQLSATPWTVAHTKLLCPWNSPGKNTRVGSLSLLQGDLPDPEIKPRSLALQILYYLSHQGSPI